MAIDGYDVLLKVGMDPSDNTTAELDAVKKKLELLNGVQTDKSMKTLKQEIKLATDATQKFFVALQQAQDEAEQIEKTFGKASKEFQEAAEKVKLFDVAYRESAKATSSLKDSLEEVNTATKNWNPDNKLQGVVTMGRAATGALMGVQGAMSFLGLESEDTLKSIQKLQGLMALSDSLSSVEDLKDAYKFLKQQILSSTIVKKADTVVTGLATGAMRLFGLSTVATSAAFKTLKVAIASTGIGVLIIAAGFLIEKMGLLDSATDDAADSQERLNRAQEKFLDNLDSKHLMEEIALKTAEFELKRMKAQGASDEAIYKKQQEVFKKQEDLAQKRLDSMKSFGVDSDTFLAQQQVRDEARNSQILAADERQTRLREKARQKQEEDLAKIKGQREQEQKDLEQHLKELDDINQAAIKANVQRNANSRDNEISDLQDEYSNKVVFLEKTRKDELKVLNQQKLSKEQFEKQKNAIEDKYIDIGLNLSADYNNKKFDIEKRYQDLINNYIESETKNQFQSRREAIENEYQDLLKQVGDAEGKLAKARDEKLTSVNTEETLRINTIKSETNLITTESDNQILDTDTADQRKVKIENIRKAEQEAEQAAFLEKMEQLKGQKEEIEKLEAEHNSKLVDINRKAVDEKKKADEDERQGKIQTYQQIGDAAGALGTIIGKQTAVSKGINAANALMNTWVGVSEIWRAKSTLPEPFGTASKVASTVIAAASGFNAVKQIMAVNVPGGGSGGGIAPSLTSQAPFIQSIQTQAATQEISNVRVVNQQDQVLNAVISDKEIKNNEDRRRFLESQRAVV